MANALVIRKSHLPSRRETFRAAQYVRMSTDKQRYSIQNQAAVIAAYAHAHNLQIVKTYRDEGESGLRIKNRAGLQQLIADVSSGDVEFSHVLVYDVSRWGRFQDTDESAHYEFVCKQAGVKIAYCAEQFDNDGSMLSSILKNLKRVMAAEYSRDLSKRVHAGLSNVARLGFRPGGPISYAFRRELVDERSQPKLILTRGQRKSLTTDRVRLKIGSDDEVGVVRWIFEQCLKSKSDEAIARELNRKAVATTTGRPWSRAIVSGILHNEVYIGNTIYNRQSRKLGGPKVCNPPELWVRGKSSVEAIVAPEVFERVSRRLDDRRIHIPEGEMLSRLRRLLHKKGRLSFAIINNASGLPTVHTYIKHFGSLRNVYRLIGYTCERDYSFVDAAPAWATVTTDLAIEITRHLEGVGRLVLPAQGDILLDGETRVLFRVARAYPEEGHLTQWRVPRLQTPASQWIIAIRLTDDNQEVLDYVLIPTTAVIKKYTAGYVRITELMCARAGFERLASAKAIARQINTLHAASSKPILPKPVPPKPQSRKGVGAASR